MEFLVTMTTRLPEGVTDTEVADVRAREAAHTAELARHGRVRRLWRPPPVPGEWRTLGLFAADDAGDLETVLASMPLRIWRTDEVTALGVHPNDPGAGQVGVDPDGSEYFTTFVQIGEPGDELIAAEARRTRELAAEGSLVRLWRLPGDGRNLGNWQASDAVVLEKIVNNLPMAPVLSVETVALTRHPSDPGLT